MSMEYRKLPRGEERVSALGIGTGGLHNAPPAEIEEVISRAIGSSIPRTIWSAATNTASARRASARRCCAAARRRAWAFP